MSAAMDTDTFWRDTLRQLATVAVDAVVEPLREPAPYLQERITLQSLGGERIVALLARPITPPHTRLPAIVTAPGYGGWEFGQMLAECQRGLIMLQVYPRLQGQSGALPDGPEKLLRGIDQPHGYYYQGAYADMVRAVDYLATRGDVDPQRIGAMGTSQGGMLTLALAALDPRIKAVVAHLPFACDMRHNPRFSKHDISTPQHLATFDHFDPAMLAKHIKAPTLLSAGGRDDISPPQTIGAVFEQLRCVKCLHVEPELDHTSSIDFHHLSWSWIDRYL
jgi:cephalosporin-C deacetylase